MAPSFFKILHDPSAPHLPLPPYFVSKHLENNIPKGRIIVSTSGGHSWRLKIKKIGDNHCFTNGWKNVVKDIPLIYADFLIFHLVDPSTFVMTIFSPNGCEEVLPHKVESDVVDEFENFIIEDDKNDEEEKENGEDVIVIEKDEDKKEEETDNDEDVIIVEEEEKENDEDVIIIGDDENDEVVEEEKENDNQVNGDDEKNEDEDPLFTSITITKTRRNMLRFPVKIPWLAKVNAQRTMAIKNVDGKEWPMCLLMEISHGRKRFYTTTGWSDFMLDYRLSEGDECVFRFIRSERKLLLAKVTKKEWSVTQPQLLLGVNEVVKRKRGRPPKDRGQAPMQPQSSGETSVSEAAKRKRGRPAKQPCEMVKRGRPENDEYKKENGEDVIIIGDDENDEVVEEEKENDDQVNGDDEKNEDEDPLFMSIIITKTRRSMLRFPVKSAGLAKVKAQETMAIKNVKAKEWPMCLRMEISHGTKRFYTTTGWSDFLLDNRLSKGDECVFQFVQSEGKLLLAKVTKKEWPTTQPQLFPGVKRKRGRQNQGEEVAKRKRGRPRKLPQSSDRIPGEEVVKRKRGRPPKNAEQTARQPQPAGETPVTEDPKRKRGRPAKQPCEMPPKR